MFYGMGNAQVWERRRNDVVEGSDMKARSLRNFAILLAAVLIGAHESAQAVLFNYYTGTITILETSGKTCKADDPKVHQIEMVLKINEVTEGYFTGEGMAGGKIQGVDKISPQLHPPDVMAGIAVRMFDQVFLVVFLGAVKRLERHDFGDDVGFPVA